LVSLSTMEIFIKTKIMSEYKFGKCIYCNKEKPLKDDVCADCNEKTELPKFFKDLFGKEK
jgi:hypothetical protein